MKVQVCVTADNDVTYIDTAVEVEFEVFPRKGEIVILPKEKVSRIVKLIGEHDLKSEYKEMLITDVYGKLLLEYQMEVVNVIHRQDGKAIVQIEVIK